MRVGSASTGSSCLGWHLPTTDYGGPLITSSGFRPHWQIPYSPPIREEPQTNPQLARQGSNRLTKIVRRPIEGVSTGRHNERSGLSQGVTKAGSTHPDTTRQPAVADATPSATTTTPAALPRPRPSISQRQSPTRPHDLDPPVTGDAARMEHREPRVRPSRFQAGRPSDLLAYAAMSLGVSTLVAVNVIQRRITNQRTSPKEENTSSRKQELLE